MAERPQIAAQLLRVLARRQRRTNNDLANLILTDVPGLVAKQLLALGQGFGTERDGGLRVTHGLTQVEIASWSGRRGKPSTRRSPISPSVAGSAWTASVLICDSEHLADCA
jgi:CRP/FNR family transcriptional regulator, cyclic AMP receptor protein